MFFAENSVKNDILTFRFIVSWKLGLVQVRIPSTIFTSVFNPFKGKKCLFIWLYWVLFAVQYLLLCIWDLAPWPGVEPQIPSLGMRSLSHWTIREIPSLFILIPNNIYPEQQKYEKYHHVHRVITSPFRDGPT